MLNYATPPHSVYNSSYPSGQHSLNSELVLQRNERRKSMLDSLSSREPTWIGVDSFMEKIGVKKAYDKFQDKTQGIFSSIANKVPAFDGSKMLPIQGPTLMSGSKDRASPFTYDFEYINNDKPKSAVARYFYALLNSMRRVAENESHNNSEVSLLPYGLTSCRYLGIDESEEGLDGYFAFKSAIADNIKSVHVLIKATSSRVTAFSEDDLGQILDYVKAVWDSQPTRLFVTVLLLHGEYVDMLVFARNSWHRYPLGKLCRSGQNDVSLRVAEMIERTMVCIWFLLTLPTSKFGHFCERESYISHLKLTHGDVKEVLVGVEAFGSSNGPRNVSIENRLNTCMVPLSGCMIHLYETMYENKPAFLKLSWTPVDRLPEGAVYDALDQFGVEGIPEAYDSGIIEQNIFGYRVEYLILEHCGQTIDKYLGGLTDRSDACAQAQKFLSQIASCLVEASHYGIYHRDVSAGNIAIKNGKAKLIGWGYGTLMGDCFNRYPELADKWKFDKKETELREQYYDRKIGTPLFMGICVIFEVNTRNIMDDIESLFYVILYCLYNQQKTKEVPDAFKFVDGQIHGMVKIGCLADGKMLFRGFRAEDITDELRQHLRELYSVLFAKDGKFIGSKLRYEPKFERNHHVESVPGLVSERAIRFISGNQQPATEFGIGGLCGYPNICEPTR